MKYQEIVKLHDFLIKHKIKHEFSKLFDGYKILFYNKEDCVQHSHVCITKAESDIIEFWVRGEDDMLRMTLKEAKKFVLKRYYQGEKVCSKK